MSDQTKGVVVGRVWRVDVLVQIGFVVDDRYELPVFQKRKAEPISGGEDDLKTCVS